MNQQKFEELFSKYREVVYRTAYSVTGNKQDALDIQQDIFLRLEYELDYWSKKFRVTPDELRDAVKRVGTSLEAIERELQRNEAGHSEFSRHVRLGSSGSIRPKTRCGSH